MNTLFKFGIISIAAACTVLSAADKYPTKPVTLITPIATGSGVDVVTRAWMNCVSQEKFAGQPVVLVNKPGANGVVAANAFRLAPPDGYTLMVAGMSATTITPFTFKKPPYDPEKDFEGAAMFGVSNLVLVATAQSGIKRVKDIAAMAKASGKGGIDFLIPSLTSPAHLLSAAVTAKLGLETTFVPVGGDAAAITAMLGGQAPFAILLAGSAAPQIAAGKLVPILSFTEQRNPQFPNAPTVVEEFGDAEMARSAWIGITTKAGSPPEVAKSLDIWTKACMDAPEFRRALENASFTPKYVGQAEFASIVRRDIAAWKPWIAKLGISFD